MALLTDYARFFHEFRHEFHTTGAILPSSRSAARLLARPLEGERAPFRILEVGPGTGVVTREIARRLRPGDTFSCVEINPRFAAGLRTLVAGDELFAPHRDVITVIEAGVERVEGEAVYDLIVSGLPLNNFAPGQVRSIFATFRRLVKSGGLLTYLEYVWIRGLKAPFVGPSERRRLSQVERVVSRYIYRHQVRHDHIFANVPPAVVRTLALKGNVCPAPAV